MNEAETRALRTDNYLRKAGWNPQDRTQVLRELPVAVLATTQVGETLPHLHGITDDCLMTPQREVLAVVEAKRSSRSERDGEEQLRLYISAFFHQIPLGQALVRWLEQSARCH